MYVRLNIHFKQEFFVGTNKFCSKEGWRFVSYTEKLILANQGFFASELQNTITYFIKVQNYYLPRNKLRK